MFVCTGAAGLESADGIDAGVVDLDLCAGVCCGNPLYGGTISSKALSQIKTSAIGNINLAASRRPAICRRRGRRLSVKSRLDLAPLGCEPIRSDMFIAWASSSANLLRR